ncbi:MAG: serine dehydrogenasease [Gammaproteobacteria bacterium]|nr:MAG: serine dehydrogenasease [Gammaproteobacteria bacterium]
MGSTRVKAIKADDYIQDLLIRGNLALARHLRADVVTIRSPIAFGLDQIVRYEVDNLHDGDQAPRRPGKLCVLVETNGGHIEVVERIYGVFRRHYRHVSFLVPDYAYSAGTVLVLSGDEIYMDYYSILGPIDPQIESNEGRFVPGLGYLQKYKELTEKINRAVDPETVRAELAYLLQKFDPAELFLLEQAKNHSLSLLRTWLPMHKFKSWKKTRGRGLRVTPAMRRKRAEEIATTLGNPERWHSHGRGIGIKELTSEEIKLDIVNFADDPELNPLVVNYYQLFTDYCSKLGLRNDGTVIHTRNGLRRF